MNADGSDQTNISKDPSADLNPTWFPDSQRVAFLSSRDGSYRWYFMNSDGSGVEPSFAIDVRGGVSATTYRGYFSPDGLWFVYGNYADSLSIIIKPVNRTGNFESYTFMGALFPIWSPDGQALAFSGAYQEENSLDVAILMLTCKVDICFSLGNEQEIQITARPGWDIPGDWTNK
jgi:TolB protein